MKKKINISIILFIFCGLIIFNMHKKDEFQIYNSYKNSFDNYETAILQVIVNKKNYDKNDMFEKIQNFYNQTGEIDELTINLYNSINDLKTGNCHASKVFIKE